MPIVYTRMSSVCHSYVVYGFSMFISFSGTSLFVIELSRIGACRLFSIDGGVSLRIEELISHEFIQWFCEWSCYMLSITFVEP